MKSITTKHDSAQPVELSPKVGDGQGQAATG
jgi:hypothetical protein